MKKTLLSLVIASVFPFTATAEVIVYGKANVSVQHADEADDSTIELVSNASRIGLKGGEEINSGLKAIYQFEYQTEVDDGAGGTSNQTFTQRNIFVGLQGSGGTVIGGKFDTPVKVIQEKVDLFNDLEGDINFLVDGDTRSNNIVQYTTPLLLDKKLAINIAHVSAEDAALDDGMSVSVTYTGSNFYAALATEQDVTAQGLDITRAVGRYILNRWQFGLLLEQSSGLNDYDGDAALASVKYNISDKLALKAQYGDASDDGITATTSLDGNDKQFSIGADYLLSKNTTIFAYYSQEKTDDSSRVILTDVVTATDADNKWLGIGIDLKF